MLVLVACAASTLEGFATIEIEVGEHRLAVAVADSSAQRRQGLRAVESLPDGLDGMLFVWGSPTATSFGMGDVEFPLDIWWFDEEGRLVGAAEMEQCPTEPCTSYRTPGEVSWALETPAGALELAPGDRLVMPDPS